MGRFVSSVVLLLLTSLLSSSGSGKKADLRIGKLIDRSISGSVFSRGTLGYEKRRLIHNGLCTHIYPDWVVVPHSTEDVAAIVKITSGHSVPISVRSGGHSFTCTSTKQGGVYIDLRMLNRVGLVSPRMAVLGPGATWEKVLTTIPPSHYTLIHGQCTSVGVGGYILGGGVNIVGTSERYGSAARHVERYTMVDATGRILLVSSGNTTVVDPRSGRLSDYMADDHGLFEAMRGAGSSYGIVTEFLYTVYPRPETLPIIAMIYMEDNLDLRKMEKAALDGRFHVSWFNVYAFRDLTLSSDILGTVLGLKILPKILKAASGTRVEPIFAQLVDNRPNAGRYTDRHEAMEFLKSYGVRLAKDDIFANILPNMLDITDYESQYMTSSEYKRRGFQGIVSCNLMSIDSLHILDNFLFNHPVFGLKKKETLVAKRAGCEFCYLVVVSSRRDISLLPLTPTGRYQIELTCTFPPNAGSKCPRVLKKIKHMWLRKARKMGDKPTQYPNTPSCDVQDKFADRYFPDGIYEKLLATKSHWDPTNVFNHCQSVGSTVEDCCPV